MRRHGIPSLSLSLSLSFSFSLSLSFPCTHLQFCFDCHPRMPMRHPPVLNSTLRKSPRYEDSRTAGRPSLPFFTTTPARRKDATPWDTIPLTLTLTLILILTLPLILIFMYALTILFRLSPTDAYEASSCSEFHSTEVAAIRRFTDGWEAVPPIFHHNTCASQRCDAMGYHPSHSHSHSHSHSPSHSHSHSHFHVRTAVRTYNSIPRFREESMILHYLNRCEK